MDTPPIGSLTALVSPVEKLIDVLARATGTLYEPHHAVRMAKAVARGEIIKAQTELDVADLKDRARIRNEAIEVRRQANIDLIVQKALLRLSNHTEAERPDQDWITGFIESCKDVSDRELQDLWSKVLADETCKPGSYNARTLAFLKYISKQDALSFSRLASYVISFGGVTCLLWELHPRSFYKQAGFTAQELQSLRRAGFLTVQEEYRLTKRESHDIEFFHRVVSFDTTHHGESTVAILLLSPEAEDLLKLTSRSYDEGFVRVILNTFKFKKRLTVFLDGVATPNDKNSDEVIDATSNKDV